MELAEMQPVWSAMAFVAGGILKIGNNKINNKTLKDNTFKVSIMKSGKGF